MELYSMSVFFRFKPVSSTVEEGWSVALEFPGSLSNTVATNCGNIELTAVSDRNTLYTFMPKEDSPLKNLRDEPDSIPKKVFLWCSFVHLRKHEVELIKQLTLYYFKLPTLDASCLVDRF